MRDACFYFAVFSGEAYEDGPKMVAAYEVSGAVDRVNDLAAAGLGFAG